MRNTMMTTCLTLALAAAAGCVDPQTSLGQLLEARRLSAELLVQFAKVNEAGHRAVMANTPEAASAAVKDITAATGAIERDAASLEGDVRALNYSRELEFLAEFRKRFAEFRTLDREILELAELDTNVKAQRLSFGPAQESADALRDALTAVTVRTAADAWQLRASRAEVLASVREIQALQAPHIAEPDDAAMTRIENASPAPSRLRRPAWGRWRSSPRLNRRPVSPQRPPRWIDS